MVQELEKIRLEWAKRDTYLRHFDLAPIKMTEWFSARPLFSCFHHASHHLPSVNKTPTKALRATCQQKSSCGEGTLAAARMQARRHRLLALAQEGV